MGVETIEATSPLPFEELSVLDEIDSSFSDDAFEEDDTEAEDDDS